MGHHPDVGRFHRQRQIEVVDIGDVVIDQRDQLIVRNFAVGFRRDLRIDQVAVVANRPLRELILGIVIGSLGDVGPIPHHDAIRDRVAAGLGQWRWSGARSDPIAGDWGGSRRCQVLAVGPNADAGAIPEDQRKTYENGFAGFQAEVILSTLLVADVAAVFLVRRVVGIIQAHRGIALEDVRVGIPHDRIHDARGIIRDAQGLQRDGVAVRVEPIGQKLPGLRTRGWRDSDQRAACHRRVPATSPCWHQVGGICRCPAEGEKGSGDENGGRAKGKFRNA